MRLPTRNAPIPSKICEKAHFYQYFEACLSALDRMHIPVHAPKEQQTAYQNCKGQLLQNVLAACDFDLRSIYLLLGWEGSATDSCVLKHAKTKDFIIPEGQYYLGDAGYSNLTSLLVPYQNTCYHLKEWGDGKHKYTYISIYL